MRRDRTALASCGFAGRALRRLGVLAGLAAAGWLLGAGAAGADELSASSLEPVAEVASEAGSEAGSEIKDARPEAGESDEDASGSASASAEDAAAGSGSQSQPDSEGANPTPTGGSGADTAQSRLASAGEDSAIGGDGSALSQVGESGRVTETAETAGSGARGVVESTTEGTGKVVTGTVHAGRDVGGFADEDPLGESELAQGVSTGLTGKTGIRDGLEETVEGPRAGLDGIAADLAPRPDHGDADTGRGAGESDRTEQRESAGDASAAAARSAQQAPPDAVSTAAINSAGAAEAAPAHSADSGDHADPLGGDAWHDASDSTGTVSSSPVPAAPAGFLTNRGHTLRLVAQRVALPDDPAVVVRYTADDPSFSPD